MAFGLSTFRALDCDCHTLIREVPQQGGASENRNCRRSRVCGLEKKNFSPWKIAGGLTLVWAVSPRGMKTETRTRRRRIILAAMVSVVLLGISFVVWLVSQPKPRIEFVEYRDITSIDGHEWRGRAAVLRFVNQSEISWTYPGWAPSFPDWLDDPFGEATPLEGPAVGDVGPVGTHVLDPGDSMEVLFLPSSNEFEAIYTGIRFSRPWEDPRELYRGGWVRGLAFSVQSWISRYFGFIWSHGSEFTHCNFRGEK